MMGLSFVWWALRDADGFGARGELRVACQKQRPGLGGQAKPAVLRAVYCLF